RHGFSFSARRACDQHHFGLSWLALLSYLERENAVLFGRNGFGIRPRNDSRVRIVLPATLLNIGDYTDRRQCRERLKIIQRSERGVILFEDEGERQAESKTKNDSHQRKAIPMRTVRPCGQTCRFDDRKSD